MAVPELPLRETKFGLVADGDGWFVLNARESRWRNTGYFGHYCDFEGKRPFRQLGINVSVLQPGQPIGLYHHERAQEDFLVLAGECLLLVEGQERALRAWDFFHCPGGTNHMIVGAGNGPVGRARRRRPRRTQRVRLSGRRSGARAQRGRRARDDQAPGGVPAVPELLALPLRGRLASGGAGLEFAIVVARERTQALVDEHLRVEVPALGSL